METFEIGIVEIGYSMSGDVTYSALTPTIKIQFDKELAENLKSLRGTDDQENIRITANSILSTWFSKMNQIELADWDKYKITSEVLSCDKYPNGNVRLCKIKFKFSPIDQVV